MLSRRRFFRGAASAGAVLALERSRAFTARRIERQARGTLPGRSDYGLAEGLRYLNHGSIGTVPNVVQEAHLGYLRTCETHPSLYVWGEVWDEAREQLRGELASFLGCEAAELAITRNTTEGFNLLAQGLPLEDGDEVLFSSLNHVGASACFQHQAERRGYRVRSFEFPVDRVPGLTAVEVVEIHLRALRPQTRLLVVPHVDNVVGLRHPLPELIEAVRERGVEFVAVDGAQAVGMIPVNLRAAGVDFYATSPHKWLQAPKGLGLFFVRDELRPILQPLSVTWGQLRWQGSARVFEDYGTRDLPEVLALSDALAFHRSVGWPQRERRLTQLRGRARQLARRHGVRWASPETWERGASLYSVDLPRSDGARLAQALEADGFSVRVWHAPDAVRLRLSPNLANTEEELDELFDALA